MAQTVDAEVQAVIDALREVLDGVDVKSAEDKMYEEALKLFELWPSDLPRITAMVKHVINGSAVKPAKAAEKLLRVLKPLTTNAKKRAAGKAKPDPGSYD